MPVLGAPLDFAKLEARNLRAHQLSAAPSGPVEGQLYYDTVGHTLYWYDGSQWQSAKGGVGAPPDASTSAKGVIQLAGDLSGTATAPTIAAGAVTSAKIADGTITDTDVASVNKNGLVGTFSMRTLGWNHLDARPGDTTLDQIASVLVTQGPIAISGQKVTNMGDPTAAQDAATKNYVDNTAQGLNAKQACIAATLGNITLSGLQTIDGYTTIAGDRILVKNQTTTANNGIYVAASGTWTRATDMDSWAEVPSSYVWIEQGTAWADTGWVCTSDPGGTLNTTAITWVQFSGAGMITAGVGLTKTGNVIATNVDGTTISNTISASLLGVPAGGIGGTQLASGAVDLTSAKVTGALGLGNGGTGQTTAKAARETGLSATGYYNNNATHGAGTTITIAQTTHGLRSSRAIHVQVQDNTTGAVELPDVVVASNGDVTITYAVSLSANTKLVTLVG